MSSFQQPINHFHVLREREKFRNALGNNVANVDTEGYSRQSVRFDDLRPQDARPGQIGQGVYAAEVYRNFNRFVENSFLNRFTQQQRWSEQSTILQSVQSIFNEANTDGISAQLATFFASCPMETVIPASTSWSVYLL